MYQRPAVTQRISYVLRKDETRNAHLLGVNALALDTTTLTANSDSIHLEPHSQDGHHSHSRRSRHSLPGGILYTGGRDGMIASWDLHFEVKQAFNGPPCYAVMQSCCYALDGVKQQHRLFTLPNHFAMAVSFHSSLPFLCRRRNNH